ncbi:hypothetical protein PENTCL1PPCAC_25733, partial [Pristionchus entomophagus]
PSICSTACDDTPSADNISGPTDKSKMINKKIAIYNLYLMAILCLLSCFALMVSLRHLSWFSIKKSGELITGLFLHIVIQFLCVVLGYNSIKNRRPRLMLPLIMYTILLHLFFLGAMIAVGYVCLEDPHESKSYGDSDFSFNEEFMFDLLPMIVFIFCMVLAVWSAFALHSFWAVFWTGKT